MMWVWLLLVAALAIPLVVEMSRRSMNAAARENAPGHFAPLSQGATHFRWYGAEGAPLVVCVHGLTSPSFVYHDIARGLAAKGFRVLTYDLYGRGYSDRVPGLQDRKFFLRQLNELLDALDIDEDIVLIGYSMGGAIGTAFASAQRERLRHLVLLAPAGMGHVGGSLFRAVLRVPVIGTWAMLTLYPSMLRKGLNEGAKHPKARPDIIRQQEAELNWRGFLMAVLQSHRGILNEDFAPDHLTLAQSGLPVTAIWGRNDSVISLEASDLLKTWNPGSVHYVIDDAAHEVTYTHSDQVLDAILERIA